MARPTILIVDTDSQLAQIVGAFLNFHGFRVHSATRGRDAVTKIGLQKYACVILEPNLRDQMGDDVIRAVIDPNGFNTKTPIILTTGSQQYDFPVELVSAIRSIIPKPFRLEALQAELLDAVASPLTKSL